jgi:predicted GTPase
LFSTSAFASSAPAKRRKLPEHQQPPQQPLVSVTLAGPPNSGKSTLFNRLLASAKQKLRSDKKVSGRLVRYGGPVDARRKRHGQRLVAGRSIREQQHVGGTALVSDLPGTTRDANSARGRLAGIDFELVDTAGIDAAAVSSSSARGSRRGEARGETSSSWMDDALLQTASAASRSDVVLLLVDGKLRGLTSDVLETASRLRSLPPLPGGRARRIRVLVNKMESFVAFSSSGDQAYPEVLREAARLGFGDPIPISALHGEGMADVAAVLQEAASELQSQEAAWAEASGALAEDYGDDENDGQDERDHSGETTPPPLKLAICGRYVISGAMKQFHVNARNLRNAECSNLRVRQAHRCDVPIALLAKFGAAI